MAVPGGHGQGLMAEQLLNRIKINPRFNQPAGIGVPQGMKTNLPPGIFNPDIEAQTSHHPGKGRRYFRDLLTQPITKNKPTIFSLTFFTLQHHIDDRTHKGGTGLAVFGINQQQCLPLKIDAVPRQNKNLPGPEATMQRNKRYIVELAGRSFQFDKQAIRLRSRKEAGSFVVHLHFFYISPGPVASDNPFPAGKIPDLTDHGQSVIDTCRSKRARFAFFRAYP